MRNFMSLSAGMVFGIGLIVSGMADPAKVLNFLDILGPWDPSLAFVMGGASVTAFIGYRLIWRRERPVMGSEFDLPDNAAIDAPLLTGAAIFGIGWGLGGFCPGPAWTSLLLGSSGILVFLPAMLVGIVLAGFVKTFPSIASKGA